MKKRKLRKPRKPTLEGWECFVDSIWGSGAGVLHKKSGRWWVGSKRLEEIGNFFLKAAAWVKEGDK